MCSSDLTQDAAAINRQDAVQVNAFGIICAPDAIVAAPAVSRAFHVIALARTRRVVVTIHYEPRQLRLPAVAMVAAIWRHNAGGR